jgi:hypothetical protein
MGDVAAFPTLTRVLVSGDNVLPYTATTAVKAGMVVAIADAGASWAVDKAIKGSGQVPVGVALYDAAAGAKVAVAGIGCVVYVVNALDGTNIDAGHTVIQDDNAIGGCVSELLAVGTDATPQKIVGVLLEDNTASASGGVSQCLITLGQVTAHA